ncbi:MAG: hypothetical protein ACK5DD_08255 [Cyclobacteriaceae bacterium]|jgi:hypothetical protein
MSDFEQSIRDIVRQEMAAAQTPVQVPVEKYCKERGLSRVTIWRAEKRGSGLPDGHKIVRIGKKVFIDIR